MAQSLVTVYTAGRESEAQVIVALLKSAGIPALVEGSSLMDEWAVSQRLLGRLGVTVQVPAERAEEAHAAIEAAHASGVLMGEPVEEFENEPDAEQGAQETANEAATPSSFSWPLAAWVIVIFGSLFFGAVFLDAFRLQKIGLRGPNVTGAWNYAGTEYTETWNDSGRICAVYTDEDLDNAFEVVISRDRAGRFETYQFDTDANGVYERSMTGELRLAMKRWDRMDRDEDGIYEESRYYRSDGKVEHWLDRDSDARVEEIQLMSATGEILETIHVFGN
ncbi:MAG: putative signal transducing protein [Planctomycetota bacterium]